MESEIGGGNASLPQRGWTPLCLSHISVSGCVLVRFAIGYICLSLFARLSVRLCICIYSCVSSFRPNVLYTRDVFVCA